MKLSVNAMLLSARKWNDNHGRCQKLFKIDRLEKLRRSTTCVQSMAQSIREIYLFGERFQSSIWNISRMYEGNLNTTDSFSQV